MKTEQVAGGTLEHWSVDEVARAFDANEIALIDVRTTPEYMFEHVDGALLMPMAFFRPDKLPDQAQKRLVFYCGSGARSARVARRAVEAGVQPFAHMEGGFAAWKQAKLPYMGTEMSTGAPKRVEP